MINKYLEIIWLCIQIAIGYNLFFPLVLLLFSKIKGGEKIKVINTYVDNDFAVIITAYEETYHIPQVVESILNQSYQTFLIYIVADKCDITNLKFDDERIIIIKP
nr:hypothetical protein [Pseudopedobacter sp.]